MSTVSNFLGDEFFFPYALMPHDNFAVNHIFMLALVSEKSKADKPVHVLEVGSWCGYSTLFWAQAIKEFCDGQGVLTCVDSWAPYHNPKDREAHLSCRAMDTAARTGAVRETFFHNLRVAQDKFGVNINSMCGTTDNILPLLQAEAFDIVFLDAAHSYESVRRDLPACARLVKEGGFLCGDDLEVQLHELEQLAVSYAKENADTDSCIADPASKRPFHPGVTLAVGEYLGPVSGGGHSFWAMQKKNGVFERVNSVMPDRIFKPAYLNEKDRAGKFDVMLKDFYDGKIAWRR